MRFSVSFVPLWLNEFLLPGGIYPRSYPESHLTPPIPQHVAFIMDGNGRWAEEQGKPRVYGHHAGAETVRRVVTHARKKNIRYLTLYAFSTENWSRPPEEVEALMQLFADFIESELPTMLDNGVQLRIIGEMAGLSLPLQEKLAAAMAATAGQNRLTLTLAVNYGGRDELVRAARKAAAELLATGRDLAELDRDRIERHLDTAGIPDPDLLVRTAGEMRLSNFLVWQSAYSELYFTSRRWPEFETGDFDAALAVYATRVRKFGGLDSV